MGMLRPGKTDEQAGRPLNEAVHRVRAALAVARQALGEGASSEAVLAELEARLADSAYHRAGRSGDPLGTLAPPGAVRDVVSATARRSRNLFASMVASPRGSRRATWGRADSWRSSRCDVESTGATVTTGGMPG
jgi:hypothetical protein